VIGLTISRGAIGQDHRKVSRALERPYEELLDQLPDQDYLNVDETGTNRTANGSGFGAFGRSCTRLFKIDSDA